MTVTKTLSIIRIILSLTLFPFFPTLACSAQYYVDGTSGDNVNDGSTSAPWKTIGHALTMAKDTDTIYIRYAVYQESLTLDTAAVSSLRIRGIAENGNQPIIDANGQARAFDLKNFNGLIQGLEIKGATTHGVNFSGTSKNAQIIGCRVHDNKKGIHVADTSTPLISGNFIYSNSECGIGSMGESSPTIDGNQIYQNGNGSPTGPSAGICIPGYSTPKVYNNIIRNNFNSGMNILDNAAPVIVHNTIAHHRGGQNSAGIAIKIVQNKGIGFVKISNNIILDNEIGLFSTAKVSVTGNSYNDLWQNDTNYSGFTADRHDIYTDPSLAVDYSLNSNSPCIDAGSPASAPATDISGVVRPQGIGFDMGAYEYQEKGPEMYDQQRIAGFLFLLLR